LPGNPDNKGTRSILSDVRQHCAQMEKIMTKVEEVYKCEVCGNIVEVRKAGDGVLVCCDEPMKKQ
jgi:superoxide reductase